MDRGRLCCGGADQRTHPPGETQKCHQSSFQTIPPAVHLVTILSPCNIFRCLICTGTQESRPCWPPPRSTATSTSGISGGPANHQIVKQEGINYQQGSTEAGPVLPDDSGSLPHKVEPRGLYLPCKVLDVRYSVVFYLTAQI